ncbi:MAG: ferrochelatase [Acidobacteria bacterium]|nr:ferrochelatase [Acidobacteriota bacterium]MBS1865900.1 ferrochelatase [Acidobacteriota bacterium]
MNSRKRIGLVLFQLGGPDSLDAVEPFLNNLFLDPDIIPMGPLGFLRKPLAKYIAKKRSVPVRGRYAMIGRRSPIGILTERQRRALVASLAPDLDVVAVTAMRYWKPLTADAVEALHKAGSLDEIVLLPLYPQFSYATTLSSLKEWRRVYGKPEGGPPERTIGQFYNHPLYIEALVQKIGVCLRQFPDASRIQLVFSAHGLPMSLVEKGDPYPKQIEETVRLTCELGKQKYGNWPHEHLLCYQSRVGPAKWLEPPFLGTLERLGHEGIKEALVVPISFVTEHIETLHEINIDGRIDAKKFGIERFRMMPAVGDSRLFISCLRDLVLTAAGIKAPEEQASSAA